MFLLKIIGSVVLIFGFASGLDPIDKCSDEYNEDFSCFFQLNETQSDVKFCILNNFTCLVNHPNDFNQDCFHNQSNPENNWQCYTEDLNPMIYSIQTNPPNQTDFIFSEGDKFYFLVLYDKDSSPPSSPPPFSQLYVSENETHVPTHNMYGPEVYSFPIKTFGTYSLKIFQPAYQHYEEVLFNITQGHYYTY